MKVIRLLLAAAWLTLTLSVNAQEVWKEKPFRQWTKDEIIKLASDSPWAQVGIASPGTGNRTTVSFTPAVTIRLRSALPMRQALVRLKQIEAKYDKMGDKERAEFDAKTDGLLGCPACVDNYVVTLGPPISNRQVKNGIGSLTKAIFAQLEKRVYLMNDRGERRELVHFVAPKHDEDEATFFFQRLDEKGQPLLTPDSKKLIFVFEARGLRSGYEMDPIPERFEFDVSRMMLDGKVEF